MSPASTDDKPSKAYVHLRARIIEMKAQPVQIISLTPLDRDQAVRAWRGQLHAVVNEEYMHDHGLSEEENERLHCLVEGVDCDVV